MNFFVEEHEEFFTPWVKDYQICRSLQNSKLYNNVTLSGKKRTPEEMFISVMNGEAVEHHYLNIWSIIYDCHYSKNMYFDLCCNGNEIEFKTFKDVNNVPDIINHLQKVPGRLSKYLILFERGGSWVNQVSYRLCLVYDLQLNEFVCVGKHFKEMSHLLFYVDTNLSRNYK